MTSTALHCGCPRAGLDQVIAFPPILSTATHSPAEGHYSPAGVKLLLRQRRRRVDQRRCAPRQCAEALMGATAARPAAAHTAMTPISPCLLADIGGQLRSTESTRRKATKRPTRHRSAAQRTTEPPLTHQDAVKHPSRSQIPIKSRRLTGCPGCATNTSANHTRSAHGTPTPRRRMPVSAREASFRRARRRRRATTDRARPAERSGALLRPSGRTDTRTAGQQLTLASPSSPA